ncbi:exopolyphosphatase PRUNE1 [Sabethes cyaneus]|uniref:exopolyphosphatase PRUNE1 n=1 Tax=Sabethes cyaneus TaxID=53552 RepID=UPI00221E3061|nr:exopolyphosphatase PRUNE1 [Sabethes cyaneus]
MNKYLSYCKSIVKTKGQPRIVVLGNESCDLDSAVCSLTFAFHLFKCPSLVQPFPGWEHVLPVLNVFRHELPIKTEVVYFLQKHQIELENLICKDEISLNKAALERTKFVLVDHHMSIYEANVVGVIDHRIFDPRANLPDTIFKLMRPVGSCATLITKIITDYDMFDKHRDDFTLVLKLLYGAIILDTVNFSKQADKAREMDHMMAEYIEQNLEISELDRRTLFENLVLKRNDVSGLDSLQILSKDSKILYRQGRTVSIPGYPILVQDYVKMYDAETNLLKFAQTTGSDVVVLMGMKINAESNQVRRDLGIVNICDRDLFEKIVTALTTSKTPDLRLEKRCGNVYECVCGIYFTQGNIAASRKQILPLIRSILDGSS